MPRNSFSLEDTFGKAYKAHLYYRVNCLPTCTQQLYLLPSVVFCRPPNTSAQMHRRCLTVPLVHSMESNHRQIEEKPQLATIYYTAPPMCVYIISSSWPVAITTMLLKHAKNV